MFSERCWICAPPEVILSVVKNQKFQEKNAFNACGFTVKETNKGNRCLAYFGPWMKLEGKLTIESKPDQIKMIGLSDNNNWNICIQIIPLKSGTDVRIDLILYGWREKYGKILSPQIKKRLNTALRLWKSESEHKTIYAN